MKVLLLEKIHPDGLEILKKAGFEVTLAENTSEEALIQAAGDCDAILVRAMIPVTGKLIRAAKKCRIISRHGVGLETIDLAAATECGIPVAYTPGANANAVAEHTVSLMLDVLKQNPRLSRKLMEQGDYACRLQVQNGELRGKTVGIVGFGNIGRSVARIVAQGFGANILAYDPYYPTERFEELGLNGRLTADLEELLSQSDIVTLHLPGSQTALINRETLALMKPGGILINTARGVLVDETALYEALACGHLAGAGLDVTAQEPPEKDNPLFTLDNIVITPHTAALTREALEAMAAGCTRQIVDYLLHDRMPWGLANPEVWEKRRNPPQN